MHTNLSTVDPSTARSDPANLRRIIGAKLTSDGIQTIVGHLLPHEGKKRQSPDTNLRIPRNPLSPRRRRQANRACRPPPTPHAPNGRLTSSTTELPQAPQPGRWQGGRPGHEPSRRRPGRGLKPPQPLKHYPCRSPAMGGGVPAADPSPDNNSSSSVRE
jgi:hypothetical protein